MRFPDKLKGIFDSWSIVRKCVNEHYLSKLPTQKKTPKNVFAGFLDLIILAVALSMLSREQIFLFANKLCIELGIKNKIINILERVYKSSHIFL
jgi:hypothetical protein